MTEDEARGIIYPVDTREYTEVEKMRMQISLFIEEMFENITSAYGTYIRTDDSEKEDFIEFSVRNVPYDITCFDEFVAERFHNAFEEATLHSHCGDCCAIASSCARCYYRDIFKMVPDGPKNKREGWVAINTLHRQPS